MEEHPPRRGVQVNLLATYLRRALLMALLCAGLTLGVAACGDSSDDDGGSTGADTTADTGGSQPEQIGRGLTIGFVTVTNCANPTICAVERSVRAEAEAAGAQAKVLEWSGASNTSPVDASIRNIDQLIAEHVDAIGIWPIDPNAAKAPMARAAKAGIPVFVFDAFDTTNPNVISTITQGRELQAKQAAEYFCGLRPEGGEVIYGDYALPIPSLQYLARAFRDHLERCSGGKITVAGVYQNATDDVAGARRTAEPVLQSHPNVFGIDAYNDATSIGASQAADSLGMRDKLKIAGYNMAPDGIDALKQGRLDISWSYQPVVMGQLIARTMLEYVAGVNRSPAKLMTVWPKCYDSSTVGDAPSNDELLERVSNGDDLSEDEPALVQRSSDVVHPADDLPGCTDAG
jgi:ABC-type sugar transport system substrate-binding protein